LPSEITPHVDKSFQIKANLAFKATTDNGVEPLGHIILPCRLCLHASNPASYADFGISIASLSPFTTGCWIWDSGMSQRFVRAWAKVFWGFDGSMVVLFGSGSLMVVLCLVLVHWLCLLVRDWKLNTSMEYWRLTWLDKGGDNGGGKGWGLVMKQCYVITTLSLSLEKTSLSLSSRFNLQFVYVTLYIF
jgi:hypothetical protein